MSLDHILLGILSYYPCSGYDIRIESEHEGMALVWSGISFGSIYPRLQKLEADGLIFTHEETTEGRRKKIFDLTEKGWRALYDWTELPPSPPVVRDELMLKISFIGSTRPEDRDMLIGHLREREKQAKDLLQYHREWTQNKISAISEHGMIIIDRAICLLEAELAWIGRTIAQLESPPQPPIQDPNGLLERQKKRRTAELAPGAKGKSGERPRVRQ